MLSSRLHTLRRHLGDALNALVAPGWTAGFAWLGIVAAVDARTARLAALMDRFEAGRLRTRKAGVRATPPGPRRAPVRPARLWPEHRPFWLWLVGFNHPLAEVRSLWTLGPSLGAYGTPGFRYAEEFVRRLRAMVETDEVMRGLLAISRAARRDVRWYWRMTSREAAPEILREAPRTTPRTRPRTTPRTAPRTAAGSAKRTRRARADGDGGPPRETRAPGPPRETRPPRPPRKTRPPRPPGPFESPPDNLSREEKVQRGMPVPDPIVIHDPLAPTFIPAHIQGRRERYRPGRG